MPPLYYDRLQANVVPETFPPDIKAFLYYFTLPERPRISAELRLRVASSDDSTSFESGYDLLGLDDQPWSRPLHVLSKFHIPLLYKKLREDRLVPDDLDAVLSTLPQKNFRYNHLYRPLYTLNDTFVIDFSGFRRLLIVVTEQGMTALEVVNLFSEVRTTLKTPYTGAYTNHHLSILLD
jgi:hypothetical protein